MSESLIAPKCKRYYKEGNNFSICVNIGEKGYVLAEHPNERYTIFYYGLYGSGLFGRIFEKNSPIVLDASENKVVDVQDYVHDKIIFEALENFYIIGFNTLDKNIKWKAQILNCDAVSFQSQYEKTYLICFNGKPIVDGKKFKRYDYACLDIDKQYKLELSSNDVLVAFSQIGVNYD